MPITHVHCCKSEGSIPVEECIAHAEQRHNECEFTAEVLRAMFAQIQDRGSRISTTAVTAKCDRSLFLERTTEQTVEPKALWPAFRGTLWHGQLELHPSDAAVEEARFWVELDGLGWFSGSPDLVDVGYGYLYDYKFTKEVPRFDRVWPDHVAQVQINRWLVDKATFVQWRNQDFVGKSVERFRPHDWQGLVVVYMDDRGPKPLTCTKSIQVPKKDGNGTKARRVVDIWPDEQVEELVYTRYETLKRYFDEDVVPDIPDGWEHQSHPLCGYCAAKKECAAMEFQQAVARAKG